MVLRIAEAFASRFFPTQYLIHIGVGILSLLVLRAFSQGRRTDRERDLHARIVLVTVRLNIQTALTDSLHSALREASRH